MMLGCPKSMKVHQIKLFIISILGFLKILIEPIHSQDKSLDYGEQIYDLADSAVTGLESRTVLGYDENWLFLRNE